MQAVSTRTKTLTKRELIEHLSHKSTASKKEIAVVICLFFEAIQSALKAHQTVQLIPFGTFTTRIRRPRNVRQPITGRILSVAAARVAVFRPGKLLRQAVR